MSERNEYPGAGQRPESEPLFSTLLASRPKRQGLAAVLATSASVITHGVLVAGLVWATASIGNESDGSVEEVVTMVVPIDAPPPPPPPPPPEAAPPPVDIPDAPKGFLTLDPPKVVLTEIPPPALTVTNAADFSGTGVEGGRADGKPVTGQGNTTPDLSAAPAFTPYTVAPSLRNREAVARALERNYPPLLRDAGIGGQVVVWIYIDENGRVLKSQVNTPSGHEQFDEAALKVSQIMEFRPATNRDRTVPVWVSIPITFTTRD